MYVGLFQAEIQENINPSTSRYLPVGEIVPTFGRDFQRDICRKSMKSERESRRCVCSL